MTPLDALSLVAPLFVPATRPDRFGKAASSGADAVIVDLEDAVPADAKDEARAHLRAATGLSVPTFVRINALGTSWFDADLAELARLGIRHICLPKVEDTALLDGVGERLGGRPVILVQIETATGVDRAAAIVSHEAVGQLAYGPADFFLDMGVPPSPTLTRHVLCRLSVASRSAGKAAPLDGPCFSVGDMDLLAAECAEALACGAGGKLCIHPSQPGKVQRHFATGSDEVAWAERVVAANRSGAAQLVDGRMIDAPIVARARAILQRRKPTEI